MRSAGDRTFIPGEPEPAEPVENPRDHVRRRSLDVGVFDAQDEDAAMAPRVEPVEKRGAGAADVEVACGGWSEADAGDHGNRVPQAGTLSIWPPPVRPGCRRENDRCA